MLPSAKDWLNGLTAKRKEVTFCYFEIFSDLPPPPPSSPDVQDGLTRHQLDAALLVAEQEQISGLPQWPEMFTLSPADAEIGSFKLRRLETMCSSHMLLVHDLSERLQMLKVGCCMPRNHH
jgi:hypothetical protein